VILRVPLRLGLAAALASLTLVGCGGSSKSQPAQTVTSVKATGGGAQAGPAAAYAPPDAVLYLRADRRTPEWKRMAPLRERVSLQFNGADGPFHLLAATLTGRLLESPVPELEAALAGESATVLYARSPAASSTDSPTRLLSYDEVVDRAAVARWLATNSRRSGDDADFALYGARDGNSASAISDHVWLTATTMADLRAAIDRAQGGQASLAGDTAFRAALARDHDADAALVGYSRGELLDTVSEGMFGERNTATGLTGALGLANAAFSVGVTGKGFWIHAHPATTPGGYRADNVFAPTLLQRVPKGTYAYLGFSDAGAQLDQLARMYDGFVGSIGSSQTSDTMPAWAKWRLGITPEQAQVFMRGEQAWWWGPQSGVAFRPADPAAALTVAQQIAGHATHLDYGIEQMTPSRDDAIVTLLGKANEGASNEPITADPAFSDLLEQAGVPTKVSLLFYLDHRLVQGFDKPTTPSGSSSPDVLGSLVIWTAPVEGGHDLGAYFNLEQRP
jgi:hypothetical protein